LPKMRSENPNNGIDEEINVEKELSPMEMF
jgi:hypothetical protein